MFFSPLLFFSLTLILGIVWQAMGFVPWLAFPLISIICIAFFSYTNRFLSLAALSCCFFFIGALRYQQQYTHFEACLNRVINTSCKLKAYITDIEPSYKKPGQTVLTMTIEELKNFDEIITPAKGMLLKITTKQPTDHLQTDDLVLCPNLFLRPCTNQNYKRYLIKEQLLGHMTTHQPFKVITRPAYSLNRWLTQKRNSILQRASQQLSPVTFTLFASIFWGKKELDPVHMDPIKDQFKIWGILHYLARSGLHVLLFVILWSWMLTWVPLPFNAKQIFMALLIIGYHVLSWPSISFIRSILLFLLYKYCLLQDLQINTLHLLSLTCIIILLINPFQLFFLDFQLSFGLTFALAWLTTLQKY